MDVRRVLSASCATLALLAPAPAGAAAPDERRPAPDERSASPPPVAPPPIAPATLPGRPPGFALSARDALALADRNPVVAEQTERYGRLRSVIEVHDSNAWQIAYSAGGVERAKVIIDGATGEVREAWTGHQVAWPMARGYEGQFGHVLNSPWVWIPLTLIFLAGLVNWRRWRRAAHLDLLVLCAFGISHVFFNRGEIGVSVPLVYPLLVYLVVRLLWLGFRGGQPLRPLAPASWLALTAVALLVFRIVINVADSGVIDVGYAGTIGADRLAHGEPLYGETAFPPDNRFGDTYGPVNYYAYVPFELALPWSGEWDALPSAHAAAIAFDLATVAGLVVFALRLRGRRDGGPLAAVLAFAWLAYPYTAFALQSNSNDGLVAALVAWSLAVFSRPVARGVLLAAAVLTKFAPVVLAGLYAAGERGLRVRALPWRRLSAFALGFAVACVLALAHPAIDPGLATFWERTVANQLERESPFSIWGQAELGWLRTALTIAVAAGTVALAAVPARRSLAQIAALAGALLVAVQLLAEHWFYLYIPWFAPAVFIALATARPAGRRWGSSGAEGVISGTEATEGGAVETEPSEHDPYDEPQEPVFEDPDRAVEPPPVEILDDDADEREIDFDEESTGLPEGPTGP